MISFIVGRRALFYDCSEAFRGPILGDLALPFIEVPSKYDSRVFRFLSNEFNNVLDLPKGVLKVLRFAWRAIGREKVYRCTSHQERAPCQVVPQYFNQLEIIQCACIQTSRSTMEFGLVCLKVLQVNPFSKLSLSYRKEI